MRDFSKVLREFSRSQVGLFLRRYMNLYPPSITPRYSDVISDLYIWRDPREWATYFNLAHLGPILNPSYKEDYEVIVKYFHSNGDFLCQRKVNLVYGESNLLDITTLSDGCCTAGHSGTFAIFHLLDKEKVFGREKICVGERGFVSYRRLNDKNALRGYAHGNVNGIAYSRRSDTSRCLGVPQRRSHYYRPQLRMDDALYSEIALVNFLCSAAEIGIYQYKKGKREKVGIKNTPSGGLVVLKSGTDFDPEYPIEFESKINFLRPVLFKYYQSHFNVLHG